MTGRDLLLCGGFALALPIGQVMFKWAALAHAQTEGPIILRLATNPALICAFAWYGASALLWFYILTRVPLSQAYPVAILGGALVPLFAWAFFREPVSWSLAAGYVLMLAGLFLTQRGAS